MSKGVNDCNFIGNLGADPEVRHTQSGAPVANLRLAVTERRKKGDQWEDHTEWVPIVLFGKQAEIAGTYLGKGSQVYVTGRMQTKSYEKDGIKRYSTEIVGERFVMLGGKGDRASNGHSRSQQRPAADPNGFADDLDGLPF